MTYLVRIRAKARVDLAEAGRWYEAQRVGLGTRFIDEVYAVLELLSGQPLGYTEVLSGTRRALLHGFPFGIYYRIVGATISIIAILHSSRHPNRWTQRT